jgi:hypothetical protein
LVPNAPGYIVTPEDAVPRPLTPAEAQVAFAAMAAKGDQIAFRYLQEGCECRAQLLIEGLVAMGIDPGRAWAVSVGRPLTVAPDPARPRVTIKWWNHTAPTVAVGPAPEGARVIDPAMPGASGPMSLAEWAAAMRARAIEVSRVPLSQATILELQRLRALAGQGLDAVVFHLPRGTAPVPEKGGSGFRIDADPPEGVSAFARAEMQRLLALERQLRPGRP